MQVEAIYDQGRLEFVHPMKLKHDHLRLVVEVPDEEIDLSVDKAAATTMHERVRAILGPYQHLLTPAKQSTSSDYKAIWHEHLEEKYLSAKQP